MRITIILLFAFTVAITAQAQMPTPDAFGYRHMMSDSNRLQKNSSVSMYTGFISGVGLLHNGSAAFLSPAIGLQLNRRLNNNMYAFAAVSAAPAFFYTGGPFNNAGYNNNFMTMPGFNTNQWGISKSIQAGLMYVNDSKTFSISGSIGVSNSSYPFHPVTQKQPMVAGSRQ
jgi:hypothetical protein